MTYPTTFTETLIPLREVRLDQPGLEAAGHLAAAGYSIFGGVRRQDVEAITDIANQEGVREFCPNDIATRFGSTETMEQWLAKDGGRGMFLLRHIGTNAIAGYGWVGPRRCQELPDCETTFAVRLHEAAAGGKKGLGRAFTAAIVSGGMAMHGARRIGLETWGSNTGAVMSYLRAGASLVTTRDGSRPTLKPAPYETGGMRRDTRLFMQFGRTFLQRNSNP